MKRLAAVIVIALAGCATEHFTGLCALQPVGMNDQGVLVARVHCQSVEAE